MSPRENICQKNFVVSSFAPAPGIAPNASKKFFALSKSGTAIDNYKSLYY